MPAATGLIAVTGATGELGRRVATRLAGRGYAQRLIVRDPSRAPSLPDAEVAVATGYDDAPGRRRALAGVRTLYLVSGRESADRVAQHVAAVDAALAAGVARIVYVSFLAAAPAATFTLARQHFQTEAHIRDTGVAFTFLRSSLYLDAVPFFASREGVIRGPAGGGRVAWFSRDDVADVGVAALTGHGHEGRTYDVTGPEALTMRETAAVLADVTGRPIGYVNETLDEAWASRAIDDAPDFEKEGWITSYAAIATGEMDVVSDAVEQLAGHAPRTLRAWLGDHPESGTFCRARRRPERGALRPVVSPSPDARRAPHCHGRAAPSEVGRCSLSRA